MFYLPGIWRLMTEPPAAAAAKSLQSCLTLRDPIDKNPPGSPVPGILQARTLEWVAISFSCAWKWKVKVKSLSWVWLPHYLRKFLYLYLWRVTAFLLFEFYLGEEVRVQQTHEEKNWFLVLWQLTSNPLLISIHSSSQVGYIELEGLYCLHSCSNSRVFTWT